MANRAYKQGNYHWANGDLSWLADNVKVALLSNAYTPNTAAGQDEFLSIIPGGAIIATSPNLSSKTNTGGALNAANPTFSSVASGSTVTQFVIYNDSGSSASSQLMVIYDTANNMPLATNGGNITIQWAGAPNYVFAFNFSGLRGDEKNLVERIRDWLRGIKIPAVLSPGGIWIPTPGLVQG